MKRSHKKIIDALKDGNRLRRNRHSAAGTWDVVSPGMRYWESAFIVHDKTIEEMVGLGLLKIQAVSGTNQLCPATQPSKGDK